MTGPALTITKGPVINKGIEAARLIPPGCVTAELNWPDPPPESDDPLPPETARAIAGALLRLGSLAFRFEEPYRPASPQTQIFPEPNRPPFARAADTFRANDDRAAFGAMITGNATDALAMFRFGGWTWGAQAALVFDPREADVAAILAVIRQGLDWRGRRLPPGAKLLFGTAADGGFALIAAPESATLANFAQICREKLPETALLGFPLDQRSHL